jgi:hypothetical protein
MDLLRHWQAMSAEDNDRLEAALLEVMDEDEAMSAIQIAMEHTVPAAAFRGAVERCAEADRLLRAAYADVHPEDVPVGVLNWLNPTRPGGQ